MADGNRVTTNTIEVGAKAIDRSALRMSMIDRLISTIMSQAHMEDSLKARTKMFGTIRDRKDGYQHITSCQKCEKLKDLFIEVLAEIFVDK